MGEGKKPFRVGPMVKALWDGEKKRNGIEGKPDMSHVTEGLARALGVNPRTKDGRAVMLKEIEEWAAIAGSRVTNKTARNWFNGGWSEDAAAMAVFHIATFPRNHLKQEILLRGKRLENDVSKAQYQLAFELCVIGDMGGGEYNDLFADAMLKIADLDIDQLRALLNFLRAFSPDPEGEEVEEPASEKVQRLDEIVCEMREWAIRKDEATGEGSCLDPGFTIPPEIIEELRASQNPHKTR